jgi:hypothetical protein
MAAGYGKGWITGECIRSKPYTHISDEDWNAIFKKPQPSKDDDSKIPNPTDENSRNNKEQSHLSGRKFLQQGSGFAGHRPLSYLKDVGQGHLSRMGGST